MPDPTDIEPGKEWFNTKPYHQRVKDEKLLKIDEDLTKIFTDTGIAIGASAPFLFGNEINHFCFAEEGKLHTIHIIGNEPSTADAGVYIPKEFSRVVASSHDTVVAENPTTREVILICHVKVGKPPSAILNENKKKVRENGTMYIGQIGGKDGEGEPSQNGRGKHAHLVFFPSETARRAATKSKSDRQKLHSLSDYIVSDSPNLGDFRTFVTEDE